MDIEGMVLACSFAGHGGINAGIACGGTPIWPGEHDLYTLDEMCMMPVITRRGDDVRIVALFYHPKFQGQGRFKALVGKIMAMDLKPVVIDPMGPTMPGIMERLVWRGERVRQPVGGYCHEWRPYSFGAIGAIGPGFPRLVRTA